jgi:hypothetical protein
MRVPHNVRTVAEIIGMDAAVRLMRATSPNRLVYIPARDIANHPLSRVLQPSELKALRRTFGGELLPYPSGRGIKRRLAAQRKAEAILAAIASGLCTAEIAIKYAVSAQYVRRIRTKGTTSSGWQRPCKDENDSQE